MAKIKINKATLNKLQKQVAAWKRKEKLVRKKLHAAVIHAKQMAKQYKLKIHQKKKEATIKAVAAEVAVYNHLAIVIRKKTKSLSSKPKVVRHRKDKNTF